MDTKSMSTKWESAGIDGLFLNGSTHHPAPRIVPEIMILLLMNGFYSSIAIPNTHICLNAVEFSGILVFFVVIASTPSMSLEN